MQSQHCILSGQKLTQKIRRMAYNLYEQNYTQSRLTFAGIQGGGLRLAELLAQDLASISEIKVDFLPIEIDKSNPQDFRLSTVPCYCDHIVLIDDVLNTGRTLFYALSSLSVLTVKKIQVAVMVNRGHRLFPVSADVVGYELSTTIRQHISVVFDGQQSGVYLY